MPKSKLDIETLKTLSDLIAEHVDHRATNLEHMLTTEHGAKFYVRNGKSYLMLAGLRADVAQGEPHATLMRNWASKARRTILKAGAA